MMIWKSYFEIITEELKLLKRKQLVLNSLLEEKRISQYIYGILKREIGRVLAEIRTRQKILDSGMVSKIEELEKKIVTLEKSFDRSIREYLETLSVERDAIQLEQKPVKIENELLYGEDVSEVQENLLEKMEETDNEMLVDESYKDEITKIDQSKGEEFIRTKLSTVSKLEKQDLSELEFPLPLDATTENLASTITIIENAVLDLNSGNSESASHSIEELLVSVNNAFEKTSEGDLNHLLLENVIQLLGKAKQNLNDNSSETVESLNETIKIFESLKDDKEAIRKMNARHPIPPPIS